MLKRIISKRACLTSLRNRRQSIKDIVVITGQIIQRVGILVNLPQSSQRIGHALLFPECLISHSDGVSTVAGCNYGTVGRSFRDRATKRIKSESGPYSRFALPGPEWVRGLIQPAQRV